MGKESQEINPAGILLKRGSAVPLYLQLYEQFRSMIVEGRLRPGDRLPAGRNLAKELGVARVIVSQAYEHLVMEGYVLGKTGAGTFVADVLPDHLLNVGKPVPVAGKADVAGDVGSSADPEAGRRINVRAFQMGMPSLDQFPYKAWHHVGNEVLKSFKNAHIGYEDTLGYWNLRNVIASYLRVSRGVVCEAAQVVVTTGSQQGLNLIVACLLQAGDEVWLEDPGYHGARMAFSNAGMSICAVPVEADGIHVSYGIDRFPNAKLAYITPSHQFPLGCTLSSSKREQLLEWAQVHNSWILEDDYDSEFRYEGRPLSSLQGMDRSGRVIYSGTFSKVLFPGLRLAYIVLPSADMVDRFRQVKENLDRQSPVLDQLFLCGFMEGGYFLRHIRKMRLLYAERQRQLLSLLKEHTALYLRFDVSSSGMHLLCWLPDNINLALFKEEVNREGLAIGFVSNYTLEHSLPPAILLGFTGFTHYQLKTGVEKLLLCLQRSTPIGS